MGGGFDVGGEVLTRIGNLKSQLQPVLPCRHIAQPVTRLGGRRLRREDHSAQGRRRHGIPDHVAFVVEVDGLQPGCLAVEDGQVVMPRGGPAVAPRVLREALPNEKLTLEIGREGKGPAAAAGLTAPLARPSAD